MSMKPETDPFHEGYCSYCAGLPRSSNPWRSTWGTQWARGWKKAHDDDQFQAHSIKIEHRGALELEDYLAY